MMYIAIAYDIDKYDTQVLTTGYFKLRNPPLRFQKLSHGKTWHLTCTNPEHLLDTLH